MGRFGASLKTSNDYDLLSGKLICSILSPIVLSLIIEWLVKMERVRIKCLPNFNQIVLRSVQWYLNSVLSWYDFVQGMMISDLFWMISEFLSTRLLPIQYHEMIICCHMMI